jgi:hypothetical protein
MWVIEILWVSEIPVKGSLIPLPLSEIPLSVSEIPLPVSEISLSHYPTCVVHGQ